MAKTNEDFPSDDEFDTTSSANFIEDEDAETLFDTEEVQKWEALPVGTHAAIVTDWKTSENQKDKSPQIEMSFTCTQGDLKGKTTKVWYPLKGNRMFVTMNMLEALNIPRTEDNRQFRMKKSYFMTRPCYINVVPNSYVKEGKTIETTQVFKVLEADEEAITAAAEYL